MKVSKKNQSPLHFARFEFKYILSEKKRNEVENDLLYFLKLDPFASSCPDGKYFVRSLYYDDPSYSCFHDKISGIRTRHKFRIRTYTNDAQVEAPVFLEIKGRHNNLVFKHRIPLKCSELDLSNLRGDQLSNSIIGCIDDSDVKQQFEYEFYRKRLSPITLIDYMRKPYYSKFDPGFRITFDEKLKATQTDSVFSNRLCSTKKVLAGYTVLEVKFRHHLPSWFHRLIQVHELRQVSISKICAGMIKLRLVDDDY